MSVVVLSSVVVAAASELELMVNGGMTVRVSDVVERGKSSHFVETVTALFPRCRGRHRCRDHSCNGHHQSDSQSTHSRSHYVPSSRRHALLARRNDNSMSAALESLTGGGEWVRR